MPAIVGRRIATRGTQHREALWAAAYEESGRRIESTAPRLAYQRTFTHGVRNRLHNQHRLRIARRPFRPENCNMTARSAQDAP